MVEATVGQEAFDVENYEVVSISGSTDGVDQEALDKALDVVNVEFGKGVLEGFTELEIQSIRPMLYELERVAVAVYSKFGGSRSSTIPLTILVEHTEKKCMGRFMAEKLQNREGEPVHQITISMNHLFNQDGTPRSAKDISETVAHETAHLYNHDYGVKDCSKGGSHNEKFKDTAEMFGLFVEPPMIENEKGNLVKNKKAVAGYGATKVIEGSELDQLLDRLELNEDAFSVGCRKFKRPEKKGNNRASLVCYCYIINPEKTNGVEYKGDTWPLANGSLHKRQPICPYCDTELFPKTNGKGKSNIDFASLISWLEDGANYGEDHPMTNPEFPEVYGNKKM